MKNVVVNRVLLIKYIVKNSYSKASSKKKLRRVVIEQLPAAVYIAAIFQIYI